MLKTTALIILLYICVSYIISYYRKQLPLIRAGNALPGPKLPLPIIGNAYYFMQKGCKDFLNYLCLLMNTYPSPCRYWLGNKLIIVTAEPDQIKTILQSSSCLNKSSLYNPVKAILGTGVFTAPAHIWIRHRKVIAACFNTNMLRAFCDTFVENATRFMEKLEHVTNVEVDLYDHIATYTLGNVFEILLGIPLKTQSNVHANPYINALLRLKEMVSHRMRNIFLIFDITFNFTSFKREQQKYLNFMQTYGEKIIQQKKNIRDNLNATKDESGKPSRKTFLDTLLEASEQGKKFTRKDVFNEIFTIIAGGTDTSALTINFAIFMLANFPEVQQKVYEELLEIYGTQDLNSAPVKFEDLRYMNYLECVLKETMRLFPAGPFIGRELDEDLQIGECTLPKGANVLIVILSLHRNEKYWPKALTFDPDRFLPENIKNIYPDSYIPFSNGPRDCIGTKFAMTTMKIFMATLLRTYVLKVDRRVKVEEIGLKVNITLVPTKPLKIKIEKRK